MTNRVAGRTLFIHRLPRGVKKEAIESIFENVIKTKLEKEDEGSHEVIKIETIKGKFEVETGENAQENETVSVFASSERSVVPASKHAPTRTYVAFDSVKSARLAFERLHGALSIDALGRPQKKAKISKRFGFEKLICVRNDTITEKEEEQVAKVAEEKDKKRLSRFLRARRQRKSAETTQTENSFAPWRYQVATIRREIDRDRERERERKRESTKRV